MARTLQFKRLAQADVANTTGANGEIIIDDTNFTVTVHDGVHAGGTRLATESYAQQNPGANAIYFQSNAAIDLALTAYGQAVTATVYGAYSFQQANAATWTVPQNPQSSNYVLQLSDAGNFIYSTSSNTQTIYLPDSNTVPWLTGTKIKLVIKGSGSMNVVSNSGVTMYLANNSTAKTHANVYSYGMADLLNVSANTWFISGYGVS